MATPPESPRPKDAETPCRNDGRARTHRDSVSIFVDSSAMVSGFQQRWFLAPVRHVDLQHEAAEYTEKMRRLFAHNERVYNSLLQAHNDRDHLGSPNLDMEEDTTLQQSAQFEQAEEVHRDQFSHPRLDNLRHRLEAKFPVLYTQVLEPTLADLREEYSAALAGDEAFKARSAFLRGCLALASATVCQIGFSLVDCIAVLWRARTLK
jgi:hypothetical protein